ncbi:hypothetical protein HAX54_036186 [Datura stramonium]|uniref:Uncharacterized protein n=1 Tax=Datura stramonium TaxID=4076 RepID=A0ABS8SG08_DATST|nr:hypothetical protein [Datura stramonium]
MMLTHIGTTNRVNTITFDIASGGHPNIDHATIVFNVTIETGTGNQPEPPKFYGLCIEDVLQYFMDDTRSFRAMGAYSSEAIEFVAYQLKDATHAWDRDCRKLWRELANTSRQRNNALAPIAIRNQPTGNANTSQNACNTEGGNIAANIGNVKTPEKCLSVKEYSAPSRAQLKASLHFALKLASSPPETQSVKGLIPTKHEDHMKASQSEAEGEKAPCFGACPTRRMHKQKAEIAMYGTKTRLHGVKLIARPLLTVEIAPLS